jgi:hypothetical protein
LLTSHPLGIMIGLAVNNVHEAFEARRYRQATAERHLPHRFT